MANVRMTIEGETFEVDVNKLGLHEGIAIQRATSLTATDLANGLNNGDMIAMAAYVWIVLKFRKGEDISWEQIESGERYVDLAAIKMEVIEPGPTEAGPAPEETLNVAD
ncbi:hypothetical protein ACQPYK_08555 [Streptosporangium sp. CA-135522]|uniref:hypothetical protein n=1 Tax=Streptosporangium sp. CA-135522 TaxID=3240072 RepID=UPI003D8B0C62